MWILIFYDVVVMSDNVIRQNEDHFRNPQISLPPSKLLFAIISLELKTYNLTFAKS